MRYQHTILFASFLGLAASLPAQLAGNYTVGLGGAYATMAAAIADLTTVGVVAPVTFHVISNDTGPWTIGAFTGQGAANPVTFDAIGPITIAGAQPVLTLNGCANVAFRGLSGTFTSTPNAFLINAGTTDCTFSNCNFMANVTTTGTTTGNAAVFNIAGGSGLRIEDSTFGGAYEALYAQFASTNTTIERCRILGGGFWIMRLAGLDITLANNFITGTSNYGISAGISGNTASGANLKIWHNSIFITHPTTASQYCSLRWYSTAAGTEVVDNVFFDQYQTTGALNMWCSSSYRPTLMDNNCLWSNIPGYFPVFATANQTFAQWQGLGFDVNSISADPMFVAPTGSPADLSLQPGSPCSTTGTFLLSVLTDIFLYPRTLPVSIGAHEEDGGGISATYTVFGPGCAGTAGVPSNTASAPLRLGTTSTITFGNLPAASLAIALVGFSNTASSFGPLPIDLVTFGAPNCFARVSADATRFLIGSSGSASFNFVTPNLASMMGLMLFTQGFGLDPTLNALGISTSDAAAALIGL